MLDRTDNSIKFGFDAEKLIVEAWGQDSIRIRSTKCSALSDELRALSGNFDGTDRGLAAGGYDSNDSEDSGAGAVITEVSEDAPLTNMPDRTGAVLINGRIKVYISKRGAIEIYDLKSGKCVMKEYHRNRKDLTDPLCSAIEIEGREFKPNRGANYHLTYRLESLDPNEKIFGMGQYQQPYLDLKGTDIEMAHRNSQASVPFFISSLGYGMLWNNPAIGRAVFGKNIMSFEAYSTKELDVWFTVADTPAELITNYTSVTGRPPMMPEYGMGFWQCKLRYQTQEQILEVAREYKRRGLPIDVIVVDFFHWPKQGEWKFDLTYWPDPDAMIKELKEMGIELMVSIWPTVDPESENYREMLEKGYLIRTERGVRVGLDFQGHTIHYDATNPAARRYVWGKAKQNYYDKGVKIFWLDEAEPEYTCYDFDNYRYYAGTDLEIGNIYPVEYAKTFYEGMQECGQENIVNLIRCAWAGSQKYGTLVWSGDIASSFYALGNQLRAGLNMGMAGIPWWTTDIGGFHGGYPDDPAFRELFARWFEFGAFCPVMRLHGDREPRMPQIGTTGGATCLSGSPNEVYSYGDEVYEICKKYMGIREHMRDYTRDLYEEAHEKGSPLIRTLFYEFPEDEKCWEISNQFMYGSKYLVAPVLEAGCRKISVYLPAGASWRLCTGEDMFEEASADSFITGGQVVTVAAPLDTIPIFVRQ